MSSNPRLQDRIYSGSLSSKSFVQHEAAVDSALMIDDAEFDEVPVMLYSASDITPSARPKQIEIRKTFPETWLFESFDFNSRYVDALHAISLY